MSFDNLRQDFTIHAIPEIDDDLETTANKLKDLASVVQRGNSLALWTGLKAATPQPRSDAVTNARMQMTPSERQAYDAWKEGKYQIPEFEWTGNVAVVPKGAQSLKKFEKRAIAMDIIWGWRPLSQPEREDKGEEGEGSSASDSTSMNARATPENASWLTFNMPATLPLIQAVVRVLNAEKQAQQNPHAGLSEMEIVEMETARKIVAAAERNRSRELERIRLLTRSITQNTEVMKARIQSLEKRLQSSSSPSMSVSPSQSTLETTAPRGEKRKQLESD
ncbi:uncharacterized protein EURHEDRAFT_295634 [Aspergillus ruber CBS 135680]|uniref:Uncharacterized protein n=1 Tax=Aspergillus ruber (strain CBS 135680) TaxID=1388766 RepID=A0A017SL32_ASPRC|nr:uncharacterized protein EURHEDRAFT_295634 [Aspergillus ruber CBS 135680]EYE97481.1 hypothetical protein EURHEDRAFT_295634 [Aspergillus ruber CBS 135680]